MASDDAEFCHLCGSKDDLSFEHIPPRRCFNNQPTSVIEMTALSNKYPQPPQRKYRAGMGRRYLCRRCNGFTGDRYGNAFFSWTVQALRYSEKVRQQNCVYLPFEVAPLNVLKQLATMAIAAAAPSPRPFHRDLRRFIHLPFERYAPDELAFHVYLNPRTPHNRAYYPDDRGKESPIPLTRMTTTCAMLDVSGRPGLMLFAEIAFPPLGYVVIFRQETGLLPDDIKDMPDISFFGLYSFNETAHVSLKLPIKIPVGPSPGHYLK